jgi:hypothetical protein
MPANCRSGLIGVSPVGVALLAEEFLSVAGEALLVLANFRCNQSKPKSIFLPASRETTEYRRNAVPDSENRPIPSPLWMAEKANCQPGGAAVAKSGETGIPVWYTARDNW